MKNKNKELQPNSSLPKSEAEKIWDGIKNLKLEMFTLPDQYVHMYYKPIIIDPVKLHLTALTKATAVLPALENAIYPKYKVEQADRFIIVTEALTSK